MKSFSDFVRNTVAHVHRQADQVRSSTACVCHSFHDARGRSAVRARPRVLQRLLGLDLLHAVHWCVTHCRQTVCSESLSAVSYDPLSHSRHNAGDRNTKVGHAIKTFRHARIIYFRTDMKQHSPTIFKFQSCRSIKWLSVGLLVTNV